jgi:hypothetical protein
MRPRVLNHCPGFFLVSLPTGTSLGKGNFRNSETRTKGPRSIAKPAFPPDGPKISGRVQYWLIRPQDTAHYLVGPCFSPQSPLIFSQVLCVGHIGSFRISDEHEASSRKVLKQKIKKKY